MFPLRIDIRERDLDVEGSEYPLIYEEILMNILELVAQLEAESVNIDLLKKEDVAHLVITDDAKIPIQDDLPEMRSINHL
jgi:hypothetical protein